MQPGRNHREHQSSDMPLHTTKPRVCPHCTYFRVVCVTWTVQYTFNPPQHPQNEVEYSQCTKLNTTQHIQSSSGIWTCDLFVYGTETLNYWANKIIIYCIKTLGHWELYSVNLSYVKIYVRKVPGIQSRDTHLLKFCCSPFKKITCV